MVMQEPGQFINVVNNPISTLQVSDNMRRTKSEVIQCAEGWETEIFPVTHASASPELIYTVESNSAYRSVPQ
jgi:hypothetical protein